MTQRPAQVNLVVKLMYTGAGLGVVNIVLLPLQRNRLREQLAESSTTNVDVEALLAFSIGLGVVFGLVGVGLWIWLGTMIGRGANWARITATVLGALSVVTTPLALVGGAAFGTSSSPLSIGMGLISFVLGVTILILLWQPQSSVFFTSSRTAPQGYPPYA